MPAEPNDKGETTDDKGKPLTRPGILADHFPPPFANEKAARANNGGALPPDLSLIVKAREGGPQYVYSILTGFDETAARRLQGDGRQVLQPLFRGLEHLHAAAADRQLGDLFRRHQGHASTRKPMTSSTFLSWASEPKMEERKRIGFGVMIFLMRAVGPAVPGLSQGLEGRALALSSPSSSRDALE